MAKKAAPEKKSARRSYLSQTDVPAYGLADALRVAQAIADSYGKNPTKPLRVAQAMNMQPGASGFRMLCGASIAYGLTEGGYNSEQIALTSLARRIVATTVEGDDFAAKREAVLRPRVFRDFLVRYNDSKLPNELIGRNVLEELGVPGDRAGDVFAMIQASAKEAGFLREVKGATYVDLEGVATLGAENGGASAKGDEDVSLDLPAASPKPEVQSQADANLAATVRGNAGRDRVFITHGKNKEIVAQLKELLTFGKFTPVIAVETETVSKPLPEKVMDEMRSCYAGIIHVGAELRLLDGEGKSYNMLNQNVLIEIGAAMALYSGRFILLVEKDVNLPSNLQGLYEVRYEGAKLDYEATMRLLKAFNGFRA